MALTWPEPQRLGVGPFVENGFDTDPRPFDTDIIGSQKVKIAFKFHRLCPPCLRDVACDFVIPHISKDTSAHNWALASKT